MQCRVSISVSGAVFILAAFVSSAAAAPTAVEKCRTAKLLATGTYVFCRLKADANQARTGDPADYSKCHSRLAATFATLDQKFECDTEADAHQVESVAGELSDDLKGAVIGGRQPICTGGCPADQIAVDDGSCSACPEQASPDHWGRVCQCDAGTYARSFSTLTCDPCPEGGSCSQPGTTWQSIQPLAGYWRPVATDPPVFYRCMIASACPGEQGNVGSDGSDSSTGSAPQP